MASTEVQRITTQHTNQILRFLESNARIQIWLSEKKDFRIEGRIIEFDEEYMNLVLDKAEEVNMKTKARKPLGRIQLKVDNRTRIMNTDSDFGGTQRLPNDLILHIFTRVPAMSVARFNCLSKSWPTLFSLPGFTKEFASKSSTRPRLLFVSSVKNKTFFYSIDELALESSARVTPYNPFSVEDVSDFNPFPCSTSQGFILLEELRGTNRQVMFNPITRETIWLPRVGERETQMYMQTFLWCDPMRKIFTVFGAFDSRADTSILVVLTSELRVWSPVLCSKPHICSRNGVCIRGILYYHALDDNGFSIGCFNMTTHKLTFLSFDESANFGNGVWSSLNHNGKLAVFYFPHPLPRAEKELYMWVLEKTEDKKPEWSKHSFAFSPLWHEKTEDKMTWPIGSTSSGEVVLCSSSRPFFLIFLNFQKKTLVRIDLNGFPQEIKRIDASFEFVEALQMRGEYNNSMTKKEEQDMIIGARERYFLRKKKKEQEEKELMSRSSA